jgi:hypothetical protein
MLVIGAGAWVWAKHFIQPHSFGREEQGIQPMRVLTDPQRKGFWEDKHHPETPDPHSKISLKEETRVVLNSRAI